ncbi:MAG: hypothetical protein ACAI35_24185 [Candidatus Methylacidiphilales bacterium]|nr:hypothetical protein [Candidatus Methylacidiphilales bacterium]
MKRGVFILLLLVLGAAAWACGYSWGHGVGWLRSSVPDMHAAHGGAAELEWLRHEFRLTQEQFDTVRRLHAEYETKCVTMCDRIVQSRRKLKELLARKPEVDAEVEQAVRESSDIWRECQLAMLRHIRSVGRVMNPEQEKRYITLMEKHLPIFSTSDNATMMKETGGPSPSGMHP